MSLERVTAKSMLEGSKQKPTVAAIDEEVVILEEDVILNREEKIPSIHFSNRVHDQVDQNMRNAIILRILDRTIEYTGIQKTLNTFKTQSNETGGVGQLNKVNVQEEVSEDKLFGPWMVVESCRRQINTEDQSNVITKVGENAAGGSRFGILQVDEDEKVIQVADLNQGGKMHLQSVAPMVQPNKGENAGQTGISIDPNKNVNSMVHKHSLTSGLHTAIIIQEKGAMATGISGTKEKRLRNIGTKTMLGTIGRNFNGRKLAVVQASGTMEVSKFITDLTKHLDSFQDPSSCFMEKGSDDVELGGSEEGLSDSDSRDNDDHHADVILVEHLVFQNHFHTCVREQNVDIMGLLKPRISGKRADKIISHLGF
ncbi:hypothetical protein GQ457_10G007530 [Hibiscus cannabinus]